VGEGLFPSATDADPVIGRTLDGRYEVLARLGAGEGGDVYRGRQVQLGRSVAIKVLQQHRAALPEWRRRFRREAKALSELAHPNIVPVTDSGIDGDLPYLVMELLEGKTLAELLDEGPLPPARALDIARQTLRGLALAHSKRIVHRDLKPANIFLQSLPDHMDHVRLLDFGMAKFLAGSGTPALGENLTRIGMVFGTPSYMSPEQARAEPVDARSDVYAAGVVLFQLFAGRLPFVAPTPEEMLKAHAREPVPPLAEARPTLTIAPFLQPIIERAMAKNRTGRFPDAASMLAALEAIAAVSQVAAAAAAELKRLPPNEDKRPATLLRRGWDLLSGSWRTGVTLVSLAAGLTTVVSFIRRDAVKPTAGPGTGVSLSAESSPRSPSQAPGAIRPGARDPWRGPTPSPLQSIRDRLDRQARVSEADLRPVYLFGRQNPGDPRPWLLVARAYAQLDWLNDAVERYLRAYRLDATCRGDPHMLPDLVKAAAHPAASRSAARAVHDIFGTEALPAIAEAIDRRAGERDASVRLARLRDELSR
jgi:serine/threonine-protein kinase